MWSWSGASVWWPGEGLAEGVDRRGADIAEDDADRADRQLVQRTAVGMAVPGVRLGRLLAVGARRFR